jgi:hypothetical protein
MYFATMQQISGHKNVAFINNYSTLSEERHKEISNILSNTETNRNALIPVQFSANCRENKKINHLFQQTELIHRNVFTNAVKQYKAQL